MYRLKYHACFFSAHDSLQKTTLIILGSSLSAWRTEHMPHIELLENDDFCYSTFIVICVLIYLLNFTDVRKNKVKQTTQPPTCALCFGDLTNF